MKINIGTNIESQSLHNLTVEPARNPRLAIGPRRQPRLLGQEPLAICTNPAHPSAHCVILSTRCPLSPASWLIVSLAFPPTILVSSIRPANCGVLFPAAAVILDTQACRSFSSS